MARRHAAVVLWPAGGSRGCNHKRGLAPGRDHFPAFGDAPTFDGETPQAAGEQT